MTPLEKADEILAEAIRIRDTHSGCHSLPSSVYDLTQFRKALERHPDDAESLLAWMEFTIAHIRRKVGLLKT
jgi:hypothetical protein